MDKKDSDTLPYSGARMARQSSQLPAPSVQFLLQLLLLSSAIGALLFVLDAPLWLFYVAPLVAVPFLIGELRTADARRRKSLHPNRGESPSARRPKRSESEMTKTPASQRSRILLLTAALLLAGFSAGLAMAFAGDDPAPHASSEHSAVSDQTSRSEQVGQSEHAQQYADAPPALAQSGSDPPRSSSVGGSSSRDGSRELSPGARSGSAAFASPLVPILIAIAVLAVLSVVFVLVRQRRVDHAPPRHRVRYR